MSDHGLTSPTLILPVGTHVVTSLETKDTAGALRAAGAVAVIVEAPTDSAHAYRVRFPDGAEASLRRQEFRLRRQVQREGLEQSDPVLAEYDLYERVIYRCVVGSRAYGLEGSESDTDRRGIYLPPAELHWSLYGVPEQLEDHAAQECYWELQKFLTLALKANPNVLECLYTPLVEQAAPLARELLERRAMFLSKLVYQTYNGYVMSQFKKLEQDFRTKGEPKWKHVMHLIRLLLSGVTVLREGFVPVRVAEQREALLAIRRGEVRWSEVNEWRLELHRRFDEAYAITALPDRPDYAAANAFLLRARRAALEDGTG